MAHGLAATGLPQRGDHSLHAAVGLIGGSPTIIRTSAWTAAFRRQRHMVYSGRPESAVHRRRVMETYVPQAATARNTNYAR
jgi:hypothetical protein